MKQIEVENIKKVTSALFVSTTFDTFCVTEASFSTLVNITIDGHINQEFLKPAGGTATTVAETASGQNDRGQLTGSEQLENASGGFSHTAEPTAQQIVTWQQIRPLCYEAIKGSRAPLKFKIVFMTPPEKVAGFLAKQNLNINASEVAGLFMNIRFEGGKLSCTSGTSTRTFSLDKSLENAWDASVEAFIRKFSA